MVGNRSWEGEGKVVGREGGGGCEVGDLGLLEISKCRKRRISLPGTFSFRQALSYR